MSDKKQCQENDKLNDPNNADRGNTAKASKTQSVLYSVGIPIGNSEDLSPRAFRVLQNADYVLAEDTRKALELSRIHGLGWDLRQIERWDAHRERDAVLKVIQKIKDQKGNWILISDAGTPGFQDPGALLIREARHEGIKIVPIPGCSALMTFISGAGLEGSGLVFRGYFPREASLQKKEQDLWQSLFSEQKNWIYFESPERIEKTLKILSDVKISGAPLQWIGAKELTKTFESFWSGTPAQVLEKMHLNSDSDIFKGEWIFAVSSAEEQKVKNSNQLNTTWNAVLEILLTEEVSVRRSVDVLVSHFQLNKNEVYAAAVAFQKKDSTGD